MAHAESVPRRQCKDAKAKRRLSRLRKGHGRSRTNSSRDRRITRTAHQHFLLGISAMRLSSLRSIRSSTFIHRRRHPQLCRVRRLFYGRNANDDKCFDVRPTSASLVSMPSDILPRSEAADGGAGLLFAGICRILRQHYKEISSGFARRQGYINLAVIRDVLPEIARLEAIQEIYEGKLTALFGPRWPDHLDFWSILAKHLCELRFSMFQPKKVAHSRQMAILLSLLFCISRTGSLGPTPLPLWLKKYKIFMPAYLGLAWRSLLRPAMTTCPTIDIVRRP